MLSEPHLFAELTRWIKANIASRLFLRDIAARFGYSQWYLNRRFLLYHGISLGAFIRLERMKASASELITSDRRIADIAVSYQFESQQTLSRAFSRQYGMPPGLYRRTMRAARLRRD
ncbi:MAG: helix-turn-helix domain-containing protein [Pantoea sp.]|uniref:helix-turn-helix domain-containing protein n=1 Tax=Pantoea sp. TaxID=69393 RepID=UPI0029156837|nr:helix-turn-helix domain-containing protein [Pantoea sp.]MDU6079420.1 helix-turn-helix domain-containing protein [Pantoea sp.]MDU7839492.1 helix-turn-helix domain-containing protein [Pantoea sp.]